MVNYNGLLKQKKFGSDHWKNYSPNNIETLLLGTTWIFFFRHYIGIRRGLFPFKYDSLIVEKATLEDSCLSVRFIQICYTDLFI